ncbi:LapA family protein [Chroococcidiopsis sp. FACHB-1243]|uniref:LapA family protein n=1 Tax=Chroococcidiopsis sp. [FACHB-1243] TaxID=2692781 RepID=UPI0017869F6F|nr:LapA family protein [Chroococcidiopsis sp. [FACHB-1243]]MBD2304071.1 LapA family protein [Chroococcidiopsis sp. [FACHB-1243]]
MKSLASLLTSSVVAVWIVAISLLSMQNADPIRLKFLRYQTIQLPVGFVLAVSAGVGVVATALMQPLWGIEGTPARSIEEDIEDEFSFDE